MSVSLEDRDSSVSCNVRTTANSTCCTDDIVNGDAGCDSVPTLNYQRSLETAVLLHEVRADALRAAGLDDEFFSLCQRALQKVGMLPFHNRVFDKLLFSANLAQIEGIRNVPTLERLRTDIEAAAAADYEERFGTAPQHVAAVNIRSACCDGIWQAVVACGDGFRAWYRVEIIDDEFEIEFLEGTDLEIDDRFTVIADMAK